MAEPLYGANASQIKRNRRIAEMLMSNSFDASPTNPYGAIARIAQGFVGGMKDKEADKLSEQRNQYIAEALTGEKTPEELMSLSAQYEAPELAQAAQFSYGKSRDAAEDAFKNKAFDYGVSRDNRNFGLQQQEFAAKEAYRNRPDAPKRYEVGDNLVDEGGNVIFQGAPKPAKLTEGEIKGEAIQAGAMPAIAALTEGGTQANPVPILDELASVQNSIGRGAENWGGAAIMSPRAQVAMDSLKSLTQQYIYALSGAQAPEQEVQRKMSTVIPSAIDSPERVAQKRAEVMGMIETLKVRAQRTEGGMATGAQTQDDPLGLR